MGIIQATDVSQFSTFDQVAYNYMKWFLVEFLMADTVVDVFDRYIDDSVKAMEREWGDEAAGHASNTYQVISIEERCLPVWKYFMNSTDNKRDLIKFIGQNLNENLKQHNSADSNQCVYFAGCMEDLDVVQRVDCNGTQTVPNMASFHEEADSRIILHTIFADQKFTTAGNIGWIIIKCKDTDVLVLAIHYFPQLTNTQQLWIQTGTVTSKTDLRRYIRVHQIYQYICISCSV